MCRYTLLAAWSECVYTHTHTLSLSHTHTHTHTHTEPDEDQTLYPSQKIKTASFYTPRRFQSQELDRTRRLSIRIWRKASNKKKKKLGGEGKGRVVVVWGGGEEEEEEEHSSKLLALLSVSTALRPFSHHLSLQTIVPKRPLLLSKTNIWGRHWGPGSGTPQDASLAKPVPIIPHHHHHHHHHRARSLPKAGYRISCPVI